MIAVIPNPLLVSRQMGHRSIRTTYDLYGHLFPDDRDRLAESLDEQWFDQTADQARTKAQEPDAQEPGNEAGNT